MTAGAPAGLLALALALVLTPLAMAAARRARIEDRPGPLKPQGTAVPYLGGAAVFAASVPWLAVTRPSLLAPLGGALVVGVVDDATDAVPPWARLVAQVAIGTGVAATVPTHLGEPAGGLLVVAVTVVLVNGVNLVDGLDALAGSVVLVSCAAFAGLLGGRIGAWAAAVAGALAGFLAYNRPPARVYLGDGGAYFLGAASAALLASAWAPGRRHATGVAALLLVAVPAAEVSFAVLRRARARQPLLSGDRRHPYDLLVARGWRPARSALAYAGIEVVLAAAALGVAAVDSVAGSLCSAGVAAVALLVLAGAYGALQPGPEVSR